MFELRLCVFYNRLYCCHNLQILFSQKSYDFLASADDPASNEKGKQRYSIGLHLSSLKLHLTLNVEDKCETEKWNGLKGRSKMLFKIEASLNCIVIPVRIHFEENV